MTGVANTAITFVIIFTVEARSMPRASDTSTVVDISLAIDPRKSSVALALILLYAIHALAAVSARLSRTVVNVDFAVFSSPTIVTVTKVGTNLIFATSVVRALP